MEHKKITGLSTEELDIVRVLLDTNLDKSPKGTILTEQVILLDKVKKEIQAREEPWITLTNHTRSTVEGCARYLIFGQGYDAKTASKIIDHFLNFFEANPKLANE